MELCKCSWSHAEALTVSCSCCAQHKNNIAVTFSRAHRTNDITWQACQWKSTTWTRHAIWALDLRQWHDQKVRMFPYLATTHGIKHSLTTKKTKLTYAVVIFSDSKVICTPRFLQGTSKETTTQQIKKQAGTDDWWHEACGWQAYITGPCVTWWPSCSATDDSFPKDV